jgi:phosphoglucosamine mutase
MQFPTIFFVIKYINMEILETAMERKIFGTDGIRGKLNVFPMTADLMLKLGYAAARVFAKSCKHKGERHKVIIGKDTRASGYIFEYALAAGLTAMGIDVYFVGPMPTPAIAHLTKSFAADAGIVISASHNPAGDNGIKFFSADGYKLPDELELEMESLIFSNKLDAGHIKPEDVGKAWKIEDARGRYIEFAKGTINNTSLKGFKIVLDCSNGAAYQVAPLIFEELGAEVITLNNTPDGLNINKDCGSLHPEKLKNIILENNADIGIALDGDADRLILVDEKGNVVDGDKILAIAAKNMKKEGALNNDTVVGTIMANVGFDEAMQKNQIKIKKSVVGDRYVIDAMKKNNLNLGGEQSGHIIFGDHVTTGDGTITALQILKIMRKEVAPLSRLASCMQSYPQVLINLPVKEKKPLEELQTVTEKIKEIEKKVENSGRVLVRYSGTQKVCRIMIEGKDKEIITEYANDIAKVVQEEIGV